MGYQSKLKKARKSTLGYEPNEKQFLFHNCGADNKLYGGAKGGGKSHALRMEAINICMSVYGVTGIIFRRTYPQLLQSIIYKILPMLPKRAYYYHKTEKYIHFIKTGSRLYFGHVQHEGDVINYQGSEFDFLLFDELTQFTEYQFKYLKGCLRTSKGIIRPFVGASANPGGVGHAFVKRLFVDKDHDEFEEKETWEYIQALVYDNPHIMKNDPSYVARLEALPEDEKKALLHADWNVFKGQYFKDFRSIVHEVQPFQIPKEWKKWRTLDYGYSKPAAVLWLAEDEDGNVYSYRELYVTQHTHQELLQKVLDLSEGEEYIGSVADPALRAKSGTDGRTFFDVANDVGIDIIPGNNDRLTGWNLVRTFLKIDESKRIGPKAKLQIFTTCPNLLRTLPQLIHDDKNVEDVNTTGEDHAPDALRYGLKFRDYDIGSLEMVSVVNKRGMKPKKTVIIKKSF